MIIGGSREIRPREQRVLANSECYWCGESPKPPHELIAVPGNPMHQSFVLVLRTPCCHAQVSTEHFGTVLDYLCDGWARARLLCRLYNASVGLPEMPEPTKPTVAWRNKRFRDQFEPRADAPETERPA